MQRSNDKPSEGISIDFPTEKSYWIVTGEWMEFIPDNPEAGTQGGAVEVSKTEAIEVHPVYFLVLVADKRVNYKYIHTLMITKKHYEWIRNVELKIAALKAAQQSSNIIQMDGEANA